MKLYELVFSAACAALCAGMIWVAGRVDEPFYVCVMAFTAAFWGSLAAFCVWGRISERQERDAWRPTIIWRR